MRLLFLYIFLLISNLTFAQFGKTNISHYEDFENKKLIVVLSDDDKHIKINEDLKYVIKEYWKFTAFEFVTEDKEDKYKTEKNAIFFKIEYTKPSNKQYNSSPSFINVYTYALRLYKYQLSKKGKVKKRILLVSNRFESLDLKHVTDTGNILVKNKNSLSAKAQLVQAIKGIISFCDYVFENKKSKDISFGKYLKEISKERKHVISKKKLLVIKNKLKNSINTEIKLKEVYPYDFEFVDAETISKAILNNDNNSVRIKFIRTNQSFYILMMNVADEKVLYGRRATGLNQVRLGPKILKELIP
ncbi:hypothetical protein [Kordia sp.]|uniref:hypothetical protein n=1 Tax=Kordia sp. TaxID=1965332 RepID=UPI003B5C937B